MGLDANQVMLSTQLATRLASASSGPAAGAAQTTRPASCCTPFNQSCQSHDRCDGCKPLNSSRAGCCSRPGVSAPELLSTLCTRVRQTGCFRASPRDGPAAAAAQTTTPISCWAIRYRHLGELMGVTLTWSRAGCCSRPGPRAAPRGRRRRPAARQSAAAPPRAAPSCPAPGAGPP